MKRVVVIGGGLAGLWAAIAAARAGAQVTVAAGGQGNHHLFSGCIDILALPPDRDEVVPAPWDAVAELIATHPDHPYARLGVDAAREALAEFAADLAAAGLAYVGDGARTLFALTALGTARPTALVPVGLALADQSPEVVCGVRGFTSFPAGLLADEIARRGAPRPAVITYDPDPVRPEPLALARALADPTARDAFADFLRERAPGALVALPAMLPVDDAAAAHAAIEAVAGCRILEVVGPPPSVPGLRLFATLRRLALDAGVELVTGIRAIGPLAAGDRLRGLRCHAGELEREIRADAVVLATGHLVGGGLIADRRGLREPIFGLPVTGESGPPFFAPRFLGPAGHPVLRTGIAVDDRLRPLDGAAPRFANLHACGDILAGFDPYRERSGGGVAIATARAAGRHAAEATA